MDGPQVGLVSVGLDNTYGHPNANTLQRLTERGIELYRSDELGDVVVTTDGEQVEVD